MTRRRLPPWLAGALAAQAWLAAPALAGVSFSEPVEHAIGVPARLSAAVPSAAGAERATVALATSAEFVLLHTDATGALAASERTALPDGESHGVSLADLDADGTPEAFVASSGASALAVFRREGGALQRGPDIPTGVGPGTIGQRIAQAAVRRAGAVERWLEAGTCGFAGPGGTGEEDAVPAGGPLRRPAVKLSAAQLLINQRIGQAAVRRVNALIDRLARDDVNDGTRRSGDLGLHRRGRRAAGSGAPPRAGVGRPSDPGPSGRSRAGSRAIHRPAPGHRPRATVATLGIGTSGPGGSAAPDPGGVRVSDASEGAMRWRRSGNPRLLRRLGPASIPPATTETTRVRAMTSSGVSSR